MLVDGKKIATSITENVAEQIRINNYTPRMVVITCAPNFETKKYLGLKQSKAEGLGIKLDLIELSKDSSTSKVVDVIAESVANSNGVIVQLPLPAMIDTEVVLNALPPTHDVDAFSYKGQAEAVLPPVVGAIDEIAKKHQVTFHGKKVVIFGEGRLVGKPSALYAKAKEAIVTIVNAETSATLVAEKTLEADIIILGVGKPNLLKPEMVKEGVVVFDAGASEDGGLLVGDASPDVAVKAALFTPVPGGIGPITIALLYRNLLQLLSSQ